MSNHPLRKFHFYNESVASVVSLTSNILLLILIYAVRNKDLDAYSVILKQMCYMDLFYSIIVFVCKPLIEFSNGTFFFFITGFFETIQHPANFLLNMLPIQGLFFCVTSLPIPFFYRYRLICKQIILKPRFFAVLFGFSFLLTLSYTIFCGYALRPTEKSVEKYGHLLNNSLWIDSEGKLPIFIAIDISDPFLSIILGYALIVGSICFSLIIWFNISIWRKLASEHHIMSARTRKLQKQLTYALITQAASPLFIAIIPISTVCICLFLNVNTSGVGIFIMSALGWLSVIDPIGAIIFVSPYRNAVLRVLCFRSSRQLHLYGNSAQIAVTSSQHRERE